MDTTILPNAVDPAVPMDAATPPAGLPDQQGTPDPQTATPSYDPAEVEDLRRQVAERDHEAAELRDYRQRAEAQLAQQAAAAWRQEDQRVLAHASQLDDPAESTRVLHDHYTRKEQFLLGTVQQMQAQVHQERVAAYADYVVREHGLSDADKTRLLWVGQSDPNAMLQEAQRIKGERQASRSEIDQLKQQLEQLTRATQANQMRASGAWQTGGGNPQPANPNIKPGSDEHLKSLLGL